MRRDETAGRIVTNLCTGVGVHDVITCADLYYDRLPCECVIKKVFLWASAQRKRATMLYFANVLFIYLLSQVAQ